MVVVEMKKKTILAIVKMFSSVRISDVTELAHLKSLSATTDLIDQLVAENRITVRVEGEMVFWSEVTPIPSKDDIENKMRMYNIQIHFSLIIPVFQRRRSKCSASRKERVPEVGIRPSPAIRVVQR